MTVTSQLMGLNPDALRRYERGEFGADQRFSIGQDPIHDASIKAWYAAVTSYAINPYSIHLHRQLLTKGVHQCGCALCIAEIRQQIQTLQRMTSDPLR